jgi:predicted ATPase
VSGRKPAESRFEARHRTGVTPLVGGDEELGCLLRRWEQAKSGEGQIVLLCGEAGIGKSRLVASFREELGSESYARVSCHCSPHHQDTALYPVTTHLARAAGLFAGEPAERQLAKLECLLGLAADNIEQVVPPIATSTPRFPA